MKRDEIIFIGLLAAFALLGRKAATMAITQLSDDDKRMLARLIKSETSDQRAWPYILATARDTAAGRGVSIARMLRTRRMQKRVGEEWEYVGSSEDSGIHGPLFEGIDDAHRWVRWASTRQPASADSTAAVEMWSAAGCPPPVDGFKSTKFVEHESEDAAIIAAGGHGWAVGKWVFRRG